MGRKDSASPGAGAGGGGRGDRLWPWSSRQAGASHAAGCLGMVRGELSKCHPNGGIPRQDKPSLRPPTMDTQCLAPAWKSGQLSQSLAPQPPQMGNQVLRRHTRQGTAVTTCRGALPERRRRQANAVSKHWHCCRACPEPLETSLLPLGHLASCPAPSSGHDSRHPSRKDPGPLLGHPLPVARSPPRKC